MVQVRGTVHDVSDNPDRVERIVVRAVEPRMHGTTYITEEPTQFPVVDGVLNFNVLPGPCVVAFLRNHGATTYEKLLVPDVADATFRECLDAAALAEEGTKSALEKVVRQIQEELSKAAPLLEEVRDLRTEVNVSKSVVDGYVKDAQKSASNAASSATNAKTSETNSASSAASAETQQKSASASAAAAKTSETNAASSESKAKTSETNAGASATAAASSAVEAKGHADRAEQATDLTGLRNEVTQQLADLVDGAPEDLDTIREVAEYAQANRGITDQLNAAIGNKANKSHTHATAEITDATASTGNPDFSGRVVKTDVDGHIYSYGNPTHASQVSRKGYVDQEVAKKSDSGHKHVSADITDASPTGDSSGGKIVRWNAAGKIETSSNPSSDNDLTRKRYVDTEVAKKRTQARWSFYGRADSSGTNWVFTPIPLPTAPKLSNGDQRINADVSGMWEIRLTCTDPNRQVEIFTSKGSVQGTGSCFTIVNLDASDYITSYRYGAADGTKIVLDMTKLN